MAGYEARPGDLTIYKEREKKNEKAPDWKTHTQLAGKPGGIGVPLNNKTATGEDLPFSEAVMNKLGLVGMNRELYLPK